MINLCRFTFFTFLSAVIVSLVLGCSQKQDEIHFNEVKTDGVAKDFKLPKKLFEQVESDLRAESKMLEPVYLFVPLQVILQTENLDVLPKTPLKFSFPNGGGSIDLKDHVRGQGSFYLSFPPEQFEERAALEHIYYVSNAPQKKIDGETFGLGCGRWVDIKAQFSKLQKPDFLKLNTTAERYLYVLAGQYIFVFRKSNQIYITHLNVTDSRYEDQLCSALSKAENEVEQK